MEGSESELQGSGGTMEGGGSLKVHPQPNTLEPPPLNGIHLTGSWPQDSPAHAEDFEGSLGTPKATTGGASIPDGGGGSALRKGQPRKAAKPGQTLGSKSGVKPPSGTTPLQAQHGRGTTTAGGALPSAHSPLSEPLASRGPSPGAATPAGASSLGEVLMLTELTMGEQRCGAHTQLLASLGMPHPGPGTAATEGGASAGAQDTSGVPREPLSVPQEQIRHLRAGLREGQSRARERANAMGVAISKLDRWLHVISTKRKARLEAGGTPLAPDKGGDSLGAPGDSPDVAAAFGAELVVSPARGGEGEGARGKSSGSRKPRTPGSAQRALSLATDGSSDTPSSLPSAATPPGQAEDGNGASASFFLTEDGHEKRISAPTMKGKRSRPGAPGSLAGSGGSFKGDVTDRLHNSSKSTNLVGPGGREAVGGPQAKPSRPKPARGPRGMFVKASSARVDTSGAAASHQAGAQGGATGPEGRLREEGEDLFEGGVAGVVSADFFEQRTGGDARGHVPGGEKAGGGGPRLATQRSRKVSRLMKVLSDGDELLNGAEGGGSFLAGSPGYQEAGTPRGRPKGRRGGGHFSAGEDEEYVEEADVDMREDEMEEYEDELEDDLDAEFDQEGAGGPGGAHRGHARLSGASAAEDEYEAGDFAPRQRSGGGKGGGSKLKRQDSKRKGGSFLPGKKKQGSGGHKGGSASGVPGGVPNGDLLFSPSDGSVPASGAVAPGGSKKGKKGKQKGKVGRPQKRPVIPTGPTGEPVCSDEEELGLAVTATAEYYAHAASGPLWQFVEPFYGIPADKDLESIAQLTECAEAIGEGHVVPGFCTSLKEQPGKRGHRLRQKRVVAQAGTAPDTQKGAPGDSQTPQSLQNGPTPEKGTLGSCTAGGAPARGSVPRPPWCTAGQMGRHVTGGPRSSVSQRLLGLLLTQVDSLSLTPPEPEPQPQGKGTTAPEPQPKDKPNSSSQSPHPPRPNGLTLDANGAPLANGAPTATELSQGQSGGPEWQKEWGGLSSDARILVELQHLGLGDCVQAMTAEEHPEDDEVCTTLRRSASIFESGSARSQELLLRLKAELARQHQPQADERKREKVLLDRLVESAYNRRTGCKVSSAPSALIPRTSHTVKVARNTSAQFAKRTLERVHAFESSVTDDSTTANAPATGGVLAAYPALREKLMQDKEPEIAPTPSVPQDSSAQLPGTEGGSGKDRSNRDGSGKGGHQGGDREYLTGRGAMSAAATPPALTPATPGLLIDVDDGEGLMYDGPGTLSQTGGALLLREAVPARTGVKRESNAGAAHGNAGAGGAWQGGGSGRWARGPSPSDWEEGRGRGRTVRLEDVGGAGAGTPLLARSASAHSDGVPDHSGAGERNGGVAQDGLNGSGSFFGPVSMPTGSWKRKRSDRDAGSSGNHTHSNAGSGKGGGAGGETKEGAQRVREKGKTKGQRNKGQRMAPLPKIAGTPPTPLQAEAPTPDTVPPASPSPWLSEPGDDLFGPSSSQPVAPAPTRRARNTHPGKSSKNRTQQLHALGMGPGNDSSQTPSMLVAASPLPWTPRDSGTPEAYSLVDMPNEPLDSALGGMGMGMGMGMQSLEEPTPVDMGMPDSFGTPGLGMGEGEAQGFREDVEAGEAPDVPSVGQEGAGGLPEPPMPGEGEGDMGWLSNLNMDNLGEGLDSIQGLAVPMDDLSELGF